MLILDGMDYYLKKKAVFMVSLNFRAIDLSLVVALLRHWSNINWRAINQYLRGSYTL